MGCGSTRWRDPAIAGATTWEREALARLDTLGNRSVVTRGSVAAHLLSAATHRGVVTNTPGLLGHWGRKDHLEYALRWYARTSGHRVARPRTLPVVGVQARGDRRVFRIPWRRIPRASSSRPTRHAPRVFALYPLARRFPISRTTSRSSCRSWSRTRSWSVGSRPICASTSWWIPRIGSRVDALRADPRPASRHRLRAYYESGDRAEITNTSYRRRLGLSSRIVPLDDCPGLEPDDARSIAVSVEDLARELLTAIASWYVARHAEPERRLMIWGLDVAITGPVGSRVALLLEESMCIRNCIGATPAAMRWSIRC